MKRGEYLVTAGACVDCHGTPQLADKNTVPLAGGRLFDLGPMGKFYTTNLTNLQDWKPEDFLKIFHQGADPDGGQPIAPIMPYPAYHGMSDADVLSIGLYLQSLTPVKNDVPNDQPGPLAKLAFHTLPAVSVPPPKTSTTAAYGAYLVSSVFACAECHGMRDQLGKIIPGLEIAGGTRNHERCLLYADAYWRTAFGAPLCIRQCPGPRMP